MANDGSVEIKIVGDDSDIKGKLGSLGDFVKGLGVFEVIKKGLAMVTSSIDSAVSRYDTLNNFPKIMQQMGYSAEESSAAVNKLSDGIQGLPTALDDIVSTTKQLTATTGDLNLATDTALALNNAFIASGSSADDASRGLQQYSQMLASGKVDAQSWRTLNETMTYALQQTAESFGYAGSAAKNDLYKALQSGTITFEDFNARIIELSTATGGFAEIALTASGGINTAFTNMKTAITKGVTSIIESIDKGLSKTKFKSIENIISSFGTSFRSTLTSIADKIPSIIAKINELVPAFSSAFNSIMGGVTKVVNAIYKGFSQASFNNIGNIVSQFGSIVGSVLSTIADLLPPIISAIDTLAPAFVAAAAGVAAANATMGIMALVSDITNLVGAFKATGLALDGYIAKTKAGTVAQAALNLVQSLNPLGLLVAAITAVVAALAVYRIATDESVQAEREAKQAREELVESTNNLLAAQEAAAEASQEAINSSMSEIDLTEQRIKELQKLISKDGELTDAEKARASVLANLINEVIPGSIAIHEREGEVYYELTSAIDELISKKRAEAVINAKEAEYQAAVEGWLDAEKERVEAQNKLNDAK